MLLKPRNTVVVLVVVVKINGQAIFPPDISPPFSRSRTAEP